MQLVLLESPLELAEALAILVKLGLELSQLHKLRGLVVLRRGGPRAHHSQVSWDLRLLWGLNHRRRRPVCCPW